MGAAYCPIPKFYQKSKIPEYAGLVDAIVTGESQTSAKANPTNIMRILIPIIILMNY